jgi:tetratricopeptide (TPR) repeat protein
VAIRANNLGSVLQDLGEMEKARRCFERALRIFQKFFGDNHPSTRRAKANLDVMKIL